MLNIMFIFSEVFFRVNSAEYRAIGIWELRQGQRENLILAITAPYTVSIYLTMSNKVDVETLHQGCVPHTLCKKFIFAERKIFVNFSIQKVIILLKRKIRKTAYTHAMKFLFCYFFYPSFFFPLITK